MRVLIVEDEAKIASLVCTALAGRDMAVAHEADGRAGLERARREHFDAIVLDIMLPGLDGFEVLKSLRAEGCRVPVLLLTARGALADRLRGFELGADDYLPKPFFVEELAVRLRSLVRREAGNVLQVGSLCLDRLTRRASCKGQAIELTAREFTLLEFLMRSAGEAFTRAQILEHVWGYDFDPATNVVDVCIRRIRSKIAEIEGDRLSPIEAVRGTGYRFRRPD